MNSKDKDIKLPCEECGGTCCNERPAMVEGYVFLDPDEYDKYPKKDVFIDLYGDRFIKTKKTGKGCIYFDEKKKICKIYDNRPRRCMSFDCTTMLFPCFFFDDHPEVFEMLKKKKIWRGSVDNKRIENRRSGGKRKE